MTALYVLAAIGALSVVCSCGLVVLLAWAPRSEKRRLRALEARMEQQARRQWDMAAARVAARRLV